MSEFDPHQPEVSHKEAYNQFYDLGNAISRWRYRAENLALQVDGLNPYALQDQAANNRREDVKHQLFSYESEHALNVLEGYETHLDSLGWDVNSGDVVGFIVFNASVYILQEYQDLAGDTQQRLWRYYYDKSTQKFRLHLTDEVTKEDFYKPGIPSSQAEVELGINDVALSQEQVSQLIFAVDVAKDAIKGYYEAGGNGIVEES